MQGFVKINFKYFSLRLHRRINIHHKNIQRCEKQQKERERLPCFPTVSNGSINTVHPKWLFLCRNRIVFNIRWSEGVFVFHFFLFLIISKNNRNQQAPDMNRISWCGIIPDCFLGVRLFDPRLNSPVARLP